MVHYISSPPFLYPYYPPLRTAEPLTASLATVPATTSSLSNFLFLSPLRLPAFEVCNLVLTGIITSKQRSSAELNTSKLTTASCRSCAPPFVAQRVSRHFERILQRKMERGNDASDQKCQDRKRRCNRATGGQPR